MENYFMETRYIIWQPNKKSGLTQLQINYGLWMMIIEKLKFIKKFWT